MDTNEQKADTIDSTTTNEEPDQEQVASPNGDEKSNKDDGMTKEEEKMRLRREEEAQLNEEEKTTRKEEALSLKIKGNELFRKEEYQEATDVYLQALDVCPLEFAEIRSVLHSNVAASFQHLDDKEKAIEHCSYAVELDPKYIKPRLRRAQLYEQTDKLDEALDDYKFIVVEVPSHAEARAACAILPEKINERNERLKAEMLGKLKDLGNLVLRPFGLSTENFQLQQDSKSGGYSIQFKQNSQR